MRVGVPAEIKPGEHRVGLTPTAAREYAAQGHGVIVEAGAGFGAGYADEAYVRAGARLAPDAEAVFREATLIVKVKEPQEVEWRRLTEGAPDQVVREKAERDSDGEGEHDGERDAGILPRQAHRELDVEPREAQRRE